MSRQTERWDKPPEELFSLNYWQVAAALCRAVNEIAINYDFDRGTLVTSLTIELEREYPNLDWANVMTDYWPLRQAINRPWD